jgi:hypothetical protein
MQQAVDELDGQLPSASSDFFPGTMTLPPQAAQPDASLSTVAAAKIASESTHQIGSRLSSAPLSVINARRRQSAKTDIFRSSLKQAMKKQRKCRDDDSAVALSKSLRHVSFSLRMRMEKNKEVIRRVVEDCLQVAMSFFRKSRSAVNLPKLDKFFFRITFVLKFFIAQGASNFSREDVWR